MISNVSAFCPDTRILHLNSALYKKKNHNEMQEYKQDT
jgi:hypothetical protein